MDDVIAALRDQVDELRDLTAGLDEKQWALDSACDGWSLADVMLHLAQTNELAVASLEDRFGPGAGAFARGGDTNVDDAAELSVGAERGTSGAEVAARWSASADAMLAGFAAIDPHRRVPWVAGQLSAHTLCSTRLAETWIHTGDVGFALGREPTLTPQLRFIARLAWRTIPYAFDQSGPTLHGLVALDLVGANGERWAFGLDDEPSTTISGDALELCLVAARRRHPADTSLRSEGPDGDAVLALIRTYA